MNFSIVNKIKGVSGSVGTVKQFRFRFGNSRVDWLLSLCVAGIFVAIGLSITAYVEDLIGNNKVIEELQRAAYEKQVLLDETSVSTLLTYYQKRQDELTRLKTNPPRLVDPSL